MRSLYLLLFLFGACATQEAEFVKKFKDVASNFFGNDTSTLYGSANGSTVEIATAKAYYNASQPSIQYIFDRVEEMMKKNQKSSAIKKEIFRMAKVLLTKGIVQQFINVYKALLVPSDYKCALPYLDLILNTKNYNMQQTSLHANAGFIFAEVDALKKKKSPETEIKKKIFEMAEKLLTQGEVDKGLFYNKFYSINVLGTTVGYTTKKNKQNK
ncbi:hypothetical protein PRIPAC_95749 [Pristionchus pacificus]|uniref:Uncharacterized protein n=1 Tax=Pristionchus pacificus TaxID=54126 RepID=A0A2A6B2Z9_PRIPA|nr:hypothetical protein PRIPAC_95749 [Pristionchus pacificus]|eukprot:PDM60233.1 hypothetical protein PRIPAC_54058 [Pristionchus pacificus]